MIRDQHRNLQAPLDPPRFSNRESICLFCRTVFSEERDEIIPGDPCPDCEELGLTDEGETIRVTEYFPEDFHNPCHRHN